MFTNPSVAQFKTMFYRDFPYGIDPAVAILDQDITNAFLFVNINMNPELFADQASYNIGYLLLAAHYLVMNMRASTQGINGQFNFLQVSKGANAISEAFSIPQRILDNPEWAILCKTNYGAQFIQLVLPQMTGQAFTVRGTTGFP